MSRTKSKTYISVVVGLFMIPVFSAGQSVDFDGKSKGGKNIKTFVAENAPVLLPVPLSKTDSELFVKREILTETGEWVELEPIKTWIEKRVKYNEYTSRPGAMTRWTLRCPKGKWTAKETYSFWNDDYGGHYHYDPAPPSLWVSNVSTSASSTVYLHIAPSPIILPEMQANTTYYYWEWLPIFATKVAEEFESYGACQISQTNYIDVKIQGLLEMPENQNYILYNSEEAMGYHPDNHYGTQKLIDTLKTIADGYRAIFPDAPPNTNQ